MKVKVGDLVLRHGTRGAKYLGLVTKVALTHRDSSYVVVWSGLPDHLCGPYSHCLITNFRWNYLNYREQTKL